MKTYTINPLTHKIVPIEMTEDMKMASDINSAYSAEEQYKFIIDVAPEYPADAGWMPIESAPKYGNDILLIERGSTYPFVGHWYEFAGNAEWRASKGHLSSHSDILDWFMQEDIAHWMPLPPAPEATC